MWPAPSRAGSQKPGCTSVKNWPMFMRSKYNPSSPTLPIRFFTVAGATSLAATVERTAPVMLARNAAWSAAELVAGRRTSNVDRFATAGAMPVRCSLRRNLSSSTLFADSLRRPPAWEGRTWLSRPSHGRRSLKSARIRRALSVQR